MRVFWTGTTPTSTNPDGSPGEQPGVSPGALNPWVLVAPTYARSLRFPKLPGDLDTPAQGTANAITAGLLEVQGQPAYSGLSTRRSTME